jgi:hypothetical protein
MQFLNAINKFVSERTYPAPSRARLALSGRRDASSLRRAVITTACLAAAGVASTAAHAGYISRPEAALDRIFSQSSFGAQRVDVRFNAGQTLASAALANVDTSGDIGALFSRATSATTVYAFYVDAVNWCGSYATGIIGCGEMPGNAIVIESNWAASPTYGATLIAHEMGHNLGLGHVSSANLMNGMLGSSTALSSTQVSRILTSSLVQWRNGIRTVSITPIAVTTGATAVSTAAATSAGGATVNAVPEPGAASLALLALGIAAVFSARRPRATRAPTASGAPRRC